MKETTSLFGLDRKKYTMALAENLPMLRAKLGISQEVLANMIGVTRQTISAAENQSRELSWPTFLSLLFLFRQNPATSPLLPVLGIYPPELERCFTVTDLSTLKETN